MGLFLIDNVNNALHRLRWQHDITNPLIILNFSPATDRLTIYVQQLTFVAPETVAQKEESETVVKPPYHIIKKWLGSKCHSSLKKACYFDNNELVFKQIWQFTERWWRHNLVFINWYRVESNFKWLFFSTMNCMRSFLLNPSVIQKRKKLLN